MIDTRWLAPFRKRTSSSDCRLRATAGSRGGARTAIVAAMLLLSACKGANEEAAELAQRANALAEAGNLVAAREAITQAIALREDNSAYYQLLGAIELKSGNPVGAYRAFNRVLDFDPTSQLALAYIANIGVQIGQIQPADDAADQLLTLQPNALPALQVKGMIALSRRKYDDAEGFADKILSLKPTDEAGTIIKARALAKRGNAEEAVKLIDVALQVTPNSPSLLTNKLNLYRFLGQPEQMAATFQTLGPLAAGVASMQLDQVNLLYRLGKKDEARRVGLALLAGGSRDPNDYRVLQRLWWEYDDAPLPEGAARNARDWKDPLALVQTVRYLLARGDTATADALIQSAPAKAQPLLASLKARLFAATGRESEARGQIDGLLAKDQHDVDALLLRAYFAMKAGQLDAAVESAQLALNNDTLNPETYVLLASIARAQGSDWRARQVYEDGIRNLPQNFLIIEKYTQFLHESGDKRRAISATRAFARTLPSSVRAWSLFAGQCQLAADPTCMQTALEGRTHAQMAYLVDDPPGTPPNRGLFGRI